MLSVLLDFVDKFVYFWDKTHQIFSGLLTGFGVTFLFDFFRFSSAVLCLFFCLLLLCTVIIGGVESILYAVPVADAIAMIIATALTILFMRSIRANKEGELPPLDKVKETAENAN